MKLNRRLTCIVFLGATLAATAGFFANRSFSAGEKTISALSKETHFHGIAVDPADGSRLLLATHHGFYVVTPDGIARQLSGSRNDFMGFTPHPTDPSVLYASGHPAGGGNLGFLSSTDGGRTWNKLSNGINGPVDFHQMDVSKADPKVIYGIYGGLQKSADGGLTWMRIGPAPEGIVAIAASGNAPEMIYAGTQRGLLVSADSGLHWELAHQSQRAATMVYAATNRAIYAFIVGTGLIRTKEPSLDWQVVNNGFGRAAILHLATGAQEGSALYAVTFDPEARAQSLFVSRDDGRTWTRLGD